MLNSLPPNCQRTCSVAIARARLSKFIEQQALYISRVTGVLYEERDDAPESYEDVCKAWYKAKLSGTAFLVYKGASDTCIYTSASVNWAFRFWHDYLHVKHGKGMTPEDEEYVAYLHITAVEHEFGKLSLEAKLIKADTLGQALYYSVWGEHVKDQLSFVLSVLDDEGFYRLADYRKPSVIGALELAA